MDIGIPTAGTLLYILIAGIVILGYGYMQPKKKKDVKKLAYGIGAVALIVSFTNIGGFVPTVSITSTQSAINQETQTVQNAASVDSGLKLISTLKSQFQYKSNGSWTAAGGNLDVYRYGDNPQNANTKVLGTTTISAGLGSTGLDNFLYSGEKYGIYFNGGSIDYDMKYPYDTINGAATTSATTTALIQFPGIMKVGTFADPMVDTLTAGEINGQTNTSGLKEINTNEIMVGTDATPALNDRWYYNETNGDGTFYLQYVISDNVSNTYIKDAVLCFVSDPATPFSANAITALSNIHISGSNANLPSDLITYWKNDECAPINNGAPLDASFSATEKMVITLDESITNANDRMYVYLDDLGEHLGKDLLLNKKASSPTVLDVTINA